MKMTLEIDSETVIVRRNGTLPNNNEAQNCSIVEVTRARTSCRDIDSISIDDCNICRANTSK